MAALLHETTILWVAVEKKVLKYYSGLFTEEEIHSLENLRGISNDVNRQLHLHELRLAWNRFYREHPPGVATREQFLQKAAEIDSLHGWRFNPSVGGSK